MTTPGVPGDDRSAPADPPAPAGRVDGRAPVLDGRPPALRAPDTPRPAAPGGRPAGAPRHPGETAPARPEAGPSEIAPARPEAAADLPAEAPPVRRSSIAEAASVRPRARVAPTPQPAPVAAPAPVTAPAAVAVAVPAEVAPVDPVEVGTMADRAVGRSLAQAPLPPHPGLGPTRRRLMVPPPSPPFVAADIPFHWRAVLPSAIGRRVTIQVGDGQLDLGGTVVSIDQVRDARFKLQVEAALFRRAASARMTVALELTDGSTVRVSARNAASSRRAASIVETLTYLWTLLGDTAGAEARQSFVERIDRGAEVQVGRLRLTGIGIAWKRNPIAPWSALGDPRREGLDVVIPVVDGDPIVVALTADDAWQLPVLVPVLRQRFA